MRWGVILGAIAAIAAAVTQLETIHDAWCKYVSKGCTYDVSSAAVTVSAGGTNDRKSDICKNKAVPVCVTASTEKRQLDVSSGKFVASVTSGHYDNGKEADVANSETGWYPKSASPREICVTVFARTGACETQFLITGKLTAKETENWR